MHAENHPHRRPYPGAQPRQSSYDIRDGKLKSFGVRETPSDRKSCFVHRRHRMGRVWKIVGDFEALGIGEGRSRADRTFATIRRG